MRKRVCIIDFARKVERVLCPVVDCEICREQKREEEKEGKGGEKKRRREEGRYVGGKSEERRRRRRSVKESIGEEKRGHGAVGQ